MFCNCSPLPMTCQPDADEPRSIPRGVVAAGNVEGHPAATDACTASITGLPPPTAQRASHKRHSIGLILIIPCVYGLHVVVMCLEQAGPVTGHDQMPSPATSHGPGWMRPGQAGLRVTRPLALTAPPSPWAARALTIGRYGFFEVSLGHKPASSGNYPRLPSEGGLIREGRKGQTMCHLSQPLVSPARIVKFEGKNAQTWSDWGSVALHGGAASVERRSQGREAGAGLHRSTCRIS